MSRACSFESEPEFVAELRLRLEAPGAPARDVLAGALTLAALDYRVLATEYAARALKDAPRDALDASLEQTAAALLLSMRCKQMPA
jgi:hypothetical protein